MGQAGRGKSTSTKPPASRRGVAGGPGPAAAPPPSTRQVGGGSGSAQRAYCFGKLPCPLHALACLFLALPPLTCPRNASRVNAEAALRHHHRLGLTGDQGEEPYGVVRHRGIAQSLSGAGSHQRRVPPLWENPRRP